MLPVTNEGKRDVISRQVWYTHYKTVHLMLFSRTRYPLDSLLFFPLGSHFYPLLLMWLFRWKFFSSFGQNSLSKFSLSAAGINFHCWLATLIRFLSPRPALLLSLQSYSTAISAQNRITDSRQHQKHHQANGCDFSLSLRHWIHTNSSINLRVLWKELHGSHT